MSWTSKAPFYDMDYTTLNEQRIKPLKLPPKSLSDVREAYNKLPRRRSILPLLVRQRMNTATRQVSRERNKQEISRKKHKQNVIRLPRLTTDIDERPNSSGSLCSLFSDAERSKLASQPPPPPNTAEIRS